MTFTAVYIEVPEGFIAFAEELPGANTQGATLEEARADLRKAVALVFEANRELAEESLRGRQVVRESLEMQVKASPPSNSPPRRPPHPAARRA
jgi:predicted RNase H-like HicB family nuclease